MPTVYEVEQRAKNMALAYNLLPQGEAPTDGLVHIHVMRHPHGRPGWDAGSTHWKVRLSCYGRSERIFDYSMGSAHTKPPSAADVLYCLVMDASTSDVSFADWCDTFGYNPDSIADGQTYKACRDAYYDLRDMLHPDLFCALVTDPTEDIEDVCSSVAGNTYRMGATL